MLPPTGHAALILWLGLAPWSFLAAPPLWVLALGARA
jgi:hypothetical protein